MARHCLHHALLVLLTLAAAAAGAPKPPSCFLVASLSPTTISPSIITSTHTTFCPRRSSHHQIQTRVAASRPVKDALRPLPPPPPTPSNEWMAALNLATLKEKLLAQPVQRGVPLLTLVWFVGYVFISPWAPGPVPNFLDPAVLKQVGGLTANYFCALPTLSPGWAPKFSPVMEGIFNVIVAYAALLSGFLVDGRTKGGAINFFAPFAAAGLALTNTAFLPYLVLRPLHRKEDPPVTQQDVPVVEQQLGESKPLLAVYGLAGLYSIYWTLLGRPEFGGLAERWASFTDLVSSDRLMFAFTVEAVLFWVFQGALVDDDLRRRGWEPGGVLSLVAKVVPFVGLFVYMMARPPLLSEEEAE